MKNELSLDDIVQRELIRDVLRRYCRAVDEKAWDVVMSCFTEDAQISHGSYQGQVSTFLDFVQSVLNKTSMTVHAIGEVDVTLEGNRANTHTSFTSYHSIPGIYDQVGPVQTKGVDTDWIVAGRYIDLFCKEDGNWKISQRKGFNDWTRVEPSNPS